MINSIKISRLGDFAAITLYNGRVFVIRLPSLPDPINIPEKKNEPDNSLGFQSISDAPT